MTTMDSAALTTETQRALQDHLLRADGQEDMCFAIWQPSRGATRESGLVAQLILPREGERHVEGVVSFEPSYFRRAADQAAAAGGGIAFLHSHPDGREWQGMSTPDIDTESRYAPRAHAITGFPLVGLTMAGDAAISARAWIKAGRRQYRRRDFESVRSVGQELAVTWNPALRPAPRITAAQVRTESAWGEAVQADLARLRVGVVGTGSVGAMIAEALARTGIERIYLIDFDSVETINLDRLLHGSENDVRCARSKVELLKRGLRGSTTAATPDIQGFEFSIVEDDGFRRALDCDVIFSCVDRPWPRSTLNYIAYAHLIPVIDVGINIRRKPDGRLRSALWRAHVAAPGRTCLECIGQYERSHVQLERDGSLDDESYLGRLPRDHYLRARQNVFAFSQSAAALGVEQLLRMVIAPAGIADLGPQRYEFNRGLMTNEKTQCLSNCAYAAAAASGESSFERLVPTGRHEHAEKVRAARAAKKRRLIRRLRRAWDSRRRN